MGPAIENCLISMQYSVAFVPLYMPTTEKMIIQNDVTSMGSSPELHRVSTVAPTEIDCSCLVPNCCCSDVYLYIQTWFTLFVQGKATLHVLVLN